VSWNGRNQFGQRLAPGIYFLRLIAEGFAATRKLELTD
jgi:hypothetical protein